MRAKTSIANSEVKTVENDPQKMPPIYIEELKLSRFIEEYLD